MVIIIELFLAITFPLIVGIAVLISIYQPDTDESKLKLISAGYLLGVGLITLILFLLKLFGSESLLVPTYAAGILIVGSSLLLKKECWIEFWSGMKFIPIPLSKNKIEYLIITLIALQVGYVFARTMIIPPSSWDEFAIWSIKAKILFYKSLEDMIQFPGIGHPDYPVMNPLAQLWVYLNLGQVDDRLGKIVFPIIYLMFLLFFYSQLKETMIRRWALLVTLGLAVIRPMSTYSSLAYSDVPLVAYYTISIIFLLEYYRNNRSESLIISALFLGLSGWLKNEGLSFLLINHLVLIAYFFMTKELERRKKILSLITYLLVSLTISLPWVIFTKYYHIKGDLFTDKIFPLLGLFHNLFPKLALILPALRNQLLSLSFGFIWPMLIFTQLILIRKKKEPSIIYLWMIILLNLTVYIAIYIISPHNITWHLRTSMDRVILHLTPIALYLLSLLFVKDSWRINN